MTALASIPEELRQRRQWVVWRSEERGGKPTKVPYTPEDPGRRASATNPKTWASFDEALEGSVKAAGIGFVFTPDDPFIGIDLDDCRNGNGLHPEAAKIVEVLDSYSEFSPSGTGAHVILRAKLNGTRHRTSKTPWGAEIEVYERGRYFAMTGNRIPRTPPTTEARQAEVEGVLAALLPERSANGSAPATPPRSLLAVDDDELLSRAFAAKNGALLESLYHGDLTGYESPSEADLALCSRLAFWAGDAERLDRLYRASGLMRPKWDQVRGASTYGAQTLAKSFEGRTEFYSPPHAQASKKGLSPNIEGAEAAAQELADLLDLPSVGLTIVRSRIVGRGSRASADLYLSDDSVVTFETIRDFANPTRLAVEIASCTGAQPILKVPMALRATALLRQIAECRESFTADQVAIDWGVTYLQSATRLAVDMADRDDRWRAFSELERHDPHAIARENHSGLARAGMVLLHVDGSRFVRCGWFHDYVRSQDGSAGSNAAIAQRMERVGWSRRGARGRIKATREGFPGQLQWSFLEVPKRWEDAQ